MTGMKALDIHGRTARKDEEYIRAKVSPVPSRNIRWASVCGWQAGYGAPSLFAFCSRVSRVAAYEGRSCCAGGRPYLKHLVCRCSSSSMKTMVVLVTAPALESPYLCWSLFVEAFVVSMADLVVIHSSRCKSLPADKAIAHT
jgi:hypothetical protein